MLFCAVTFLTVIWVPFAEGPDDWMPLRMQLVMTFFVIGLASFLLWAPLVAYRFLEQLR